MDAKKELKKAINIMLTSIGEQPIQNVDDKAGLSDASIAETILLNTSRAVQSRGWIFNTDLDWTLTPNQMGEITIDDTILRVDTTTRLRDADTDIVERGRKLYDRKKNTSTFPLTSKVKVDLVKYLNFHDLPEPAKRYITIRSARIFQDRVLSSTNIHGFQLQDEQQAYIELQDYHAETADFNIFDNYDTFAPLDRNIYGEHYITNTLTETSS